LESGLPANLQGRLTEANTVWKNLIPLNKAPSQRADERIPPRALQRAMAQQRRTDVTRLPHDPMIDDALKVLPSTIPDSGTAGRLLLGGVGTGVVGYGPEFVAAALTAGTGATRPVQRALVGNTAWQKALGSRDQALTAAMMAALRNKRKEEE
jgi:hypothetical protein